MRADMVYFETPEGRVFDRVYYLCGSLPWNNFDNTVSRLLLNVLSRSLGNLSLAISETNGRVRGEYRHQFASGVDGGTPSEASVT